MSNSPQQHPSQLWYDGHLDLAYLAEGGRDLTLPAETAGGANVPGAVSFSSLHAGHVAATLGTIFIARRDPKYPDSLTASWCFGDEDEAFAAGIRQINWYQRWHDDGHLCLHPQADNGAPLRVMLLMEGCAGVRTPADLLTFHHLGVRVISLTWNDGTKYAGGDQSGGPLTAEGKILLQAIDDLRMVHDVSHLSEQAFWQLLDAARGPKVASHSNCRALLPGKAHPDRHLSDAQIKALASNGMIGINLFSKFLVVEGRASIANVVQHIQHMTQVAGSARCIGLGSDMDGGFSTEQLPAGLEGPEQLPRLLEALSAAGFTDAQIRDFAFDNWQRFLAAHVTL